MIKVFWLDGSSLNLCQVVVPGANIGQLDSSGRTPLHLAAELGHTECLRVLVNSKGANIDQQTKEKQQTPLHLAAQKRHLECVEVLLDHGALANITDYR